MTCKTCTNVSLTNSWQEVDTALQANHVLDSLTDQQWAACSLSRYVTFLKSRITYDPLLSTWDLASVTLDDKIVTHCLFPTSRTVFLLQLLDWILRGAAQVMFVNNPLSGLIIFAGLILQNYWWALNGFVGTLFATISALILQQNRFEQTDAKENNKLNCN